MKENEFKEKAYLEVLMKLRRLIDTEYKNGGRLPPSREMSRKFDVTLPTYGKAIERLLLDGTVYKNSNKGIFVHPDASRSHKTGLILDSGNESPFLSYQELIGKALLKLAEKHLNTQLLQAPSRDRLQMKAFFHGINSILWILSEHPNAELLETIGTPLLPIVIINTNAPPAPDWTHSDRICCVSRDCVYEGRRRAELLLKNGAKHVLYAGKESSGENYGFFPALRNGGASIALNRPLDTTHQLLQNLLPAIREEGIDTLYTEGGSSRFRLILEELMKLPKKMRPVLYGTYFPEMPSLLRKYPEIRFAGACLCDCSALAEPAVEMLASHLFEGKPLKSHLIRSFHLFSPGKLKKLL